MQHTEVLTAAISTNQLVETAHDILVHVCSTFPWVLYKDLIQRTQPQTIPLLLEAKHSRV